MSSQLIQYLKERDIYAMFHYIPLHTSPAGKKYGLISGDMSHTENLSDRILRLPLFFEITNEEVHRVSEAVIKFYEKM